MKPGVRLAALVLIAAAGLSACGGSSDETSRTEEPAARIEVTSVSGSIRVEGDDGAGEITIETTRRWDASAPEIVTERDGDLLRIFHDCAEGDDGCSVDYALAVPEDITVTATSTSGDVSVVSVTGDVTVETVSGDVTVNDIGGALGVTTTSGGILGVNLKAVSGSVTTVSGRIDISWEDPVDDLTARSESGDVTVQVPGQPYALTATSTSGDVDVRIDTDPADDKTVTIESVSGNIRVYAG